MRPSKPTRRPRPRRADLPAPAPPLTSSFRSPSGLSLTIHDWGGDGPPVLLAHPTGFHGYVWAPVAERLVAAGRHPWSFDFRGQGNSDPSPVLSYSWLEFGEDALAVTHHLGLAGDPSLLAAGHSKGAAALLLGALREPTTYSRLWCFEPIILPVMEPLAPVENSMSEAARRRRDIWASRDEAFASYSSRPPLDALAPESLRAYVDYGLADRADGTVALKCRPEHEALIYTMGPNHNLYAQLDQVQCPVVVACGERTDAIVPSLAEKIAERIPHSRLEVWEGRGHFGPLEDPDRAVASMLAFADER